MSFAEVRVASCPLSAVVFDSNVLISAALMPHSNSAKALVQALQQFELCLSEHTWIALQQVIARPKFARYLTEQARHEFLHRLVSVSRFVPTHSVVTDCSDPKDNPFLALAQDAQAGCIVSGDHHLLVLHPWRGIQICTPAQFLLLNP